MQRTTRAKGAVALALAALAAGTVAGRARAQDLRGPELGGKITSEIGSLTDIPDVDDYSAELIAGETLSLKLGAAKKSDARFRVTVFDPGGDDRTFDGVVKIKKDGAKIQVKKLPVDETGRWTVRVEARDGAEGGYQLVAKVKKAKPIKLKKQTLAGASGSADVAVHEFGAAHGGALDVSLKWGKKDVAIDVRDVRGPLGTLTGVFGEEGALSVGSRSAKLKKHPLDAGTGEHAVELAAEGSATYTLKLKVQPPARPGGKRDISPVNDPQLDPVGETIRSAPGQVLRITGRNLSLSPIPTVYFGPFRGEVIEVGPARTFVDVLVPVGEDGTTQPLTVVNPDGQAAYVPDYLFYVPEAIVTSVTQIAGSELGDGQVPRADGVLLEVRGQHLRADDVATLNDDVVVMVDRTDTLFRVALPPGVAGPVTFRLTDIFDRVQEVPDVVRRVGFDDVTASAVPAPSDDDDLSAWDGAIGDLDNDGWTDDLVIVTYSASSRVDVLYGPDPEGRYLGGVAVPENPVGDREIFTRLFFLQPDGRLADVSDDNLPEKGDDAGGFDDLNALAVAIGDLDGDTDNDLVLAGSAGAGDTSKDFSRVRVLLNDGDGAFSHANVAFEAHYIPKLTAFDETYNPNDEEPTGIWPIAEPRQPSRLVTTLAIGDLDGDGDPEVIAGAPDFSSRVVRYDPEPVDLSRNPPYIFSGDVTSIDPDGLTRYYSATQVFDNRLDESGEMVDVSESVLPGVGTSADPGRPAFRARHLLVGDVDGDDDLDVVVTWNNPASLVPLSAQDSFGGYPRYSYGVYQYVFDEETAEEVASTRVLVNDGEGTLTDATEDWFPATSADEHWHAHRMALADLDGDEDLDLVLLHRRALNAYRYLPGITPPPLTRPSLRVLRNDGDRFTDVTATAVPPEIVGRASHGRALAVGDVDLDGRPEIVFGAAPDPDEYDDFRPERNRQPPFTRVLWNRGGLRFELNPAFDIATDVDSGEAHALLIGDVDRNDLPAVHVLTERAPQTSGDDASLRVHEWQR